MKCREFQDRWQRRLDGQPVVEAGELEGHLAECPTCRGLDAAARRLEFGLRVLPSLESPPDLADRIVTVVLRDRWERLRWRRRVLVAASLAASLLVAVAGYSWLRLSRTTASSVPATPVPLVQAPRPAEARPPTNPPASLNASVEEAGSAVVSLTRRTAGETVGQTRLLLPEKVTPPSLTSARVLPHDLVAGPPAQSLQETRQGVTSGLEPMTTSARRAVDLFLNELPPVSPGTKPGL
jgi:hypothetical protein